MGATTSVCHIALRVGSIPTLHLKNFLENDLIEKLKKSAVANAITIPLPPCFSCFVLLRRFLENLPEPFYFYLSRTCGPPGVTPSVISLALKICALACRRKSMREEDALSRKTSNPPLLAYPGKRFGLKFIPRQSDLFRFIPKSVSAPTRTHSNQSEKSFQSRLM